MIPAGEDARDRYRQIVDQISREDTLYETKLNACIFFNLALAAGAGTQLTSERITAASYIILVGCGAVGILITRVYNHYLDGSRQQLIYLKREFEELDRCFPQAFVAPFLQHGTNLPVRAWTPRKWSRIPFLFAVLWSLTLVAGPVLVFLQ